MRTSEQIYHQVRWDPRFDPARFVLGIDMRGRDPKRVALPAFRPGGDIPWHRVLFVEADGVLVWDRASGVDRIDSAGAGLARQTLRLRPPFFTARTPRRWDAVAGWAADTSGGHGSGSGGVDSTGTSTRTSLRVLTWNTLWDRYDPDRIDTARRRPLLLADLARADADVIALQEVEPALLTMLLDAPWVRAEYTVTVDLAGRDVDDAGLLLLSRLPVLEAGWQQLAPHKAVAAIVVESFGGPLAVAVTHLSSDHSEDGAARRAAELLKVKGALGSVDCGLVVVGDFNDGSDGPDGPAAELGLADAWTAVHGAGDRTATFDPAANRLAAVSSLSGRASRLDRVLVRGGGLQATAAVLRGDTPTADGLHISDHYGVQVDFEFGDAAAPSGEVLDTPGTARSALAWLPPQELWPAIQEVRQAHDPQIDRWPPHVNVLFGFVPESEFEQAAALVAAAAEQVAPFEAVLDGLRTFQHPSGNVTLWLDPAAAGPADWATLREAVGRAFPACHGRRADYTPHLTLGRVRKPAPPVSVGPLRAEVRELTLLSRRGEGPMEARAVVELGSGKVRWLRESTALDRTVRDNDNDALAQQVAHTIGATLPEAVLHVVGSRRMGCALPDADLDVVASFPGLDVGLDIDDLRARITAALPSATHVREVVGARVPGLRFRVGTLDVDLTLVTTSDREPFEAEAVALSAVTDAEAVLASVIPDQTSFTRLARLVKAWARARGLDSAPFGGVPGLAWCVLAAQSVAESADPADFFGTYAARDWSQPIWTPSGPRRDLLSQVGAGFRDLIADELYRAWEIVESGEDPWSELFEPPPLHRRHAAWAVVTVRAKSEAAFDETSGRTRGRMRALITALEEDGTPDVHAWPRPFETGPNLARFAIGLGRAPIDAARLRAIARPWERGLAGVDVDHAVGGEMPTLR